MNRKSTSGKWPGKLYGLEIIGCGGATISKEGTACWLGQRRKVTENNLKACSLGCPKSASFRGHVTFKKMLGAYIILYIMYNISDFLLVPASNKRYKG